MILYIDILLQTHNPCLQELHMIHFPLQTS